MALSMVPRSAFRMHSCKPESSVVAESGNLAYATAAWFSSFDLERGYRLVPFHQGSRNVRRHVPNTLRSFREKLRIILKATRTHARNLATFALIYKTCMLVLRHSPRSFPTGGLNEASYDTFLAGLIGGYAVFGRGYQSSVNQQIVIYVFARVVLALAKLSVVKGGIIPGKDRAIVTKYAWPVFAACSWGGVMWLFRWHSDTIQPSMRSSMRYMYVCLRHHTLQSSSSSPDNIC